MIGFKFSLIGFNVVLALTGLFLFVDAFILNFEDISSLIPLGIGLLGISSVVFHIKSLKIYRVQWISGKPYLGETNILRNRGINKINLYLWISTAVLAFASLCAGGYLGSFVTDIASHFDLLDIAIRLSIVLLILYYGLATFIDLLIIHRNIQKINLESSTNNGPSPLE